MRRHWTLLEPRRQEFVFERLTLVVPLAAKCLLDSGMDESWIDQSKADKDDSEDDDRAEASVS